eukprot:TRINITY_DN7837_c0_g1_i2.p1 TRINITY_DN7837_c0_g1~~TRINITY_DN7837_c0_g1_i2.p1  ORF type:complete len:465 (+),score=94.57 TRINITY_DN7837_c0_g1_i2:49-1395(+)
MATVSELSSKYARMVEELRTTFKSGRSRSLEWRRKQLEAIQQMIAENHEAVTAAVREDLGGSKMRGIAEWSCVEDAAYAVKNIKSWSKPDWVSGLFTKGYIYYEPKGVVFISGPWNFPFNMIFQPLVAAIVAGNCAVMKPSEMSPHCAALIQSLVERYLDPDCFRVVQGAIPESTALLSQHWDHIFYTGGISVGKIVMAAAAENLTPVTLELGGKSPVIVDKAAKLDTVCERILSGKFINCGQLCVAPDYVLVDESMMDAFMAKMVALTEQAYGKDAKSSHEWGRIIDARHMDRLRYLLETSNGNVACGGINQIDREELFFPPTIIRQTDLHAPIMQEEIFGPLLPVLSYSGLDEALDIVEEVSGNAPLSLYIFSPNKDTVKKLLAAAPSGNACINGTFEQIIQKDLPFGGQGLSGTGSYHGKYGFEEFSHRRAVLHKSRLWGKRRCT